MKCAVNLNILSFGKYHQVLPYSAIAISHLLPFVQLDFLLRGRTSTKNSCCAPVEAYNKELDVILKRKCPSKYLSTSWRVDAKLSLKGCQ